VLCAATLLVANVANAAGIFNPRSGGAGAPDEIGTTRSDLSAAIRAAIEDCFSDPHAARIALTIAS